MKKIFIITLPLPLIVFVSIAIMLLFRDEVKQKKSIPDPSDAFFIEGDQYFQGGKYQDAIRAYQDARHHYPTSNKAPKALFYIGRSYEHLKLYLEAAATYQTFLEFYPHDPLTPQVWLAKAAMDLNLEKLQEAKDELINIINQYTAPDISSKAKHLLANCYYKLKDYTNTQKYYEMVFSLTLSYLGGHQQDYLQMGEVYVSNKEFSKARQVLLRLINIYPQSKYSDKALTILGDSFYAEGELEKALLLYGYPAKYYPLSEWGQRSRLRLADLSLEKNQERVTDLAFYHPDYSDPLKAYEEIADESIYPEVLELALMKLGTLLYQQGNYLEAYKAFKRIGGEYIDSRYYKQAQSSAQETIKKLVDSLYYQNDFLSVVDFYRENQAEIEQDSDPRLLFQIASSCQNLGLYAPASKIYKRAAKYSAEGDGLSQEILLNLGETYNQDEKYSLAEKVIGDFLIKYAKKYNTCRAYPILIDALYHQEKFLEAINVYLQGLKPCPKNNLYINYLIGTSYQKTGNISQAKAYFEQALQLFPKLPNKVESAITSSGSLSIQIGDFLYRAKDYKGAAEVYSKALKMQGTRDVSPWIIYQLGRSYQKQGLKKEARKAYTELLSQTNDPFWEDLAQVWLD